MGKWYSFWSITLFMIFTNPLNAKDPASVKPMAIYVKTNADDIKKFSAAELQKHLFLITGVLPEIRNNAKTVHSGEISFFVGIKPPGKDNKALMPEESRYVITKQKVYLYGYDKITKHAKNKIATAINKLNQTGTLFAVYDFLFNELGVRWIEPGDRGIMYKKQIVHSFADHHFSWKPKYNFRIFRSAQWQWKRLIRKKIISNKGAAAFFQFSEKEINERYVEEGVWFRRMKLGMHDKPRYGHAFRHYWEEYGDEHSEWFALDRFGFRGVTIFNRIDPTRVKFCVSNKELQKEIVKNWQHTERSDHYYNACINDSKKYCICSECRSLDVNKDMKSMTDRYVYFWNALLDGIKKYDKNARLIVYAYSDYRFKPVSRKISSDITIGLVPNYADSIKEVKDNFLGWRESGMVNYFLRPNDFNYDVGLPAGNEKFIYNRFKIFASSHMLGIDYDRNYNLSNWEINGIGSYILARAISDNKSFVELENEYLKTFGDAKEEIAAYYVYWRNIFEKKQLKYMESVKKYKRKLIYKNLHDFYEEKNFTHAESLLDAALLKVSDDLTIHRIRRMKLANKHTLLIFNAIVNKKKKSSCELNDFRKIHHHKLLLSWPTVLFLENHYKATGVQKYCQ